MSVGLFGLIAVPVALLHQAYLRAGSPPGERSPRWWLPWRTNPSLTVGAVVLAIALALAAPWYARMFASYGAEAWSALVAPFDAARVGPAGSAGEADRPGPAAMPLGLFAAVRLIRQALVDENDDPSVVGGVLWVLWLAVAALAPAFWPGGPRTRRACSCSSR